ncbi:unnamed protein product, partial [Allacma fusca]
MHECVCNFLLACWFLDPHQRPSFKEILRDLEKISRSPFGCYETFHMMQETWKTEIAAVLEDMKHKEEELQSREEQVKKQTVMQEIKEEHLKIREQEVAARETKLLQMVEIFLILQQSNTPRPTPIKRKGKFRGKGAVKKEQIISGPSDFRHTLTVQTTEYKGLRSFSSPETPPGSPNVGLRTYV